MNERRKRDQLVKVAPKRPACPKCHRKGKVRHRGGKTWYCRRCGLEWVA